MCIARFSLSWSVLQPSGESCWRPGPLSGSTGAICLALGCAARGIGKQRLHIELLSDLDPIIMLTLVLSWRGHAEMGHARSSQCARGA